MPLVASSGPMLPSSTPCPSQQVSNPLQVHAHQADHANDAASVASDASIHQIRAHSALAEGTAQEQAEHLSLHHGDTGSIHKPGWRTRVQHRTADHCLAQSPDQALLLCSPAHHKT